MRDDLAFVEQIHRELQGVRWPAAQEIRARARRRSQRRIVVATVVLALTGASAVATAAPGQSPAPGLPAAAPTRHEIPLDALLQPADLQQQVYTQLSQSGLGEPVRLEETLGYCRTSQGLSDGWQTSNVSRSQTLMRRHSPDHLVEGDVLLMQDLFRLAPETARQLFVGLDDVVAPCARWRTVGQAEVNGTTQMTEVIHRWSVARRGFAGDDAAILRDSLTADRDVQTGQALSDEPTPLLLAVVRVGDTVSVLRPGYDGTESDLVQLAEAAAARMCAAANPAC
ncbi:hypothetical protein [Micromonospora sp. NBC_00617]|uniref:hypothetical protein n=1 Tax=Micromonospora sp. NBC_00617 TaxID=2903587 RepID=UPI0030E0B488